MSTASSSSATKSITSASSTDRHTEALSWDDFRSGERSNRDTEDDEEPLIREDAFEDERRESTHKVKPRRGKRKIVYKPRKSETRTPLEPPTEPRPSYDRVASISTIDVGHSDCEGQDDVIQVPEVSEDTEATEFTEAMETMTWNDMTSPTKLPVWNDQDKTMNHITGADKKYPRDCYSFLALHGPRKVKFFLFGLLPFVFQIVFLVLLLWSVMDEKRGTYGDSDNPDAGKPGLMGSLATFIPGNVNPIVSWTQVTSIVAYVLYPSSSLQDVIIAFRCFPRPSEVNDEDPVGCMRFSCILRGIQGVLAVFAAFLLVITSDTVVDIILNFTAVNFISNIDNAAFYLAMSGDFGPPLRREAERITNKDLPTCMYKPLKHIYYRIVVGLTFVPLFGIMLCVICAQLNNNLWITRTLRVQFQAETGLKEYSGCFRIDDSSDFYGRRSYDSISEFHEDIDSTSFGYCIDDRQWILFKGDDFSDPCDARAKSQELARSAKTDAFDISTSFDESWVSSSNTPLDLYFFESGDETDLHCGISLDDGVCDPVFNELGYQYDGGDCCAATCTQSNCGRGGIENVFGNPNSPGFGFPYCQDPAMKPMTIHIDSIFKESFWFESDGRNDIWLDDDGAIVGENHVDPYFSLDCNGKTILSAYIKKTMVDTSETVMVEDGANCSIIVRNTTAGETLSMNGNGFDPILYIKYTLFHDFKDNTKSGGFDLLPGFSTQGFSMLDASFASRESNVKILSQSSKEKESVNFKRIPECYFDKLRYHVDIGTIYTGSDPSNKAIQWLVDDSTGNSLCEDANFVERYGLLTMNYALNEPSTFISRDKQCTWPSITCSGWRVTTIKLVGDDFFGEIPSEIGLFPRLEELHVSLNKHPKQYRGEVGLTSIPPEIGYLMHLQTLDLYHNRITYVPAEIGNLASLSRLRLDYNQISSPPSEIGKLVNLKVLHLDANGIESIPTEFGNLLSLEKLSLNYNKLASLPKEIGYLSNLQILNLYGNKISSLPTEIGSLSNLKSFDLYLNKVFKLPTEIGNLSSLKNLAFDMCSLSLLPTEFGRLTSLEHLDFYNNQLRSLPTEIGNLSELKFLDLDFNLLTALPTEIGLMTSLQNLNLTANNLLSIPTEIGLLKGMGTNSGHFSLSMNSISSIPSEIGMMANLTEIDMARNEITNFPSEIGLLTNLKFIDLSSNDISYIPSEIGLLTNLEIFKFTSNDISFVPSEIGLLTNLKELILYGSNVTYDDIPYEVDVLCLSISCGIDEGFVL